MDRLVKFSIPVLSACTLGVIGSVARLNSGARYRSDQPVATRVANWRLYALGGHRVGPVTAPVTVVAFIDYECPFARKLSAQLEAIEDMMRSQVAVVYRHFPLPGHKNAVGGAIAAECAAQQGKFSEYHRALIKAPTGSFGPRAWSSFASTSAVADTASFTRCLASRAAASAVQTDTRAGQTLGIVGTPTFLVNEQKYEGLPRDLQSVIRSAIVASSRPKARSKRL
jgi:protein-disulfide isomerase